MVLGHLASAYQFQMIEILAKKPQNKMRMLVVCCCHFYKLCRYERICSVYTFTVTSHTLVLVKVNPLCHQTIQHTQLECIYIIYVYVICLKIITFIEFIILYYTLFCILKIVKKKKSFFGSGN